MIKYFKTFRVRIKPERIKSFFLDSFTWIYLMFAFWIFSCSVFFIGMSFDFSLPPESSMYIPTIESALAHAAYLWILVFFALFSWLLLSINHKIKTLKKTKRKLLALTILAASLSLISYLNVYYEHVYDSANFILVMLRVQAIPIFILCSLYTIALAFSPEFKPNKYSDQSTATKTTG